MKSNAEWKQWGELDPLWAVSTWKGREKDGPKPWTDEEFYRYGDSDCSDFIARWRRYGFTPGTCVEIGCGAGRITKGLAGFFEKVVAFDVSEGMINYARKGLEAQNVEFIVTDGVSLPLPDGHADAAFSAHVFQHFDSVDDGVAVFRELYRALKAGGTLMIHLPLYNWPGTGNRVFNMWHVFKIWRTRLLARCKKLVGEKRPAMRGTWYESNWLLRQLDDIGYDDAEVCYFRVRSNGALHPFLLARKPTT